MKPCVGEIKLNINDSMSEESDGYAEISRDDLKATMFSYIFKYNSHSVLCTRKANGSGLSCG